MRTDWESYLERWAAAGMVDSALALRIRGWEAAQARPQRLRWPVMLALACGALALCAGVLLFVSSHWNELGPAARMALVLAMVALFHAGGAAATTRFEGLSIALHTVGTVSLGAAIALTGQIFQLNEHWPGAILLWAVGALIAWVLLRHWTQAALVALLVPCWLAGEWAVYLADHRAQYLAPVCAGICALSFTYLSARRSPSDNSTRRALAWLGGLALLPSALLTAVVNDSASLPSWGSPTVGFVLAGSLPLALAVVLRRREAVWNAGAVLWTLLLAAISYHSGEHLLVYAWYLLGAMGLAWWGVRESRSERVNLAMAGFAITLLVFYFSSVMDKLGRSASLIALGLLFLGGGWGLERLRRRLISQMHAEAL